MPLKELVKDAIWEYENFLEDEEVDLILSTIARSDESEWYVMPIASFFDPGTRFPISTHPDTAGLIRDINDRISGLFVNKTNMIQVGSVIRGTDTLRPIREHRDNENGPEDGDVNTVNKYGVLIYLNSDFDGGEIYYPEFNIEYKPKRGALLVHDAGDLHGVRPISNGVRYSMTSFIWGLDAKIIG